MTHSTAAVCLVTVTVTVLLLSFFLPRSIPPIFSLYFCLKLLDISSTSPTSIPRLNP